MVKKTISIHPFIDLILKEVWQAGIAVGWPRPSYSLAVEASIMTPYYDLVPTHRLPRKEAVESVFNFCARKTKIMEKDERMLHDYIQYFLASRNKDMATFRL